MIDCKKAQSLANGYIDDTLSEAECSAYEEHISCCENCHEEYYMLKRMVGDMNKMPVSLPQDFSRKLHTALVSEQLKDNKKERKFTFPYYRTASVVMAAFVIAIVGKFGIYDVYHKVSFDNQDMVKELVSTEKDVKTGADKEITQKEAEKTDSIVYVQKAPVTEEAEVKVPEVVETESVQILEETAAPVNEAPAVTQQETAEEIMSDENLVKSRAIENQPEPVSAGSGATVENVNADMEAVPPAAEPVPAYVEIYGSGDGSMIMIKKYLLTFLDSGLITEQDGKITVTVKDTEYHGVISRLKENEYVKSVTESGTSEGEVQIIIG